MQARAEEVHEGVEKRKSNSCNHFAGSQSFQTLQTIDDCADLCGSFGRSSIKFGNLSNIEPCSLFQVVKLSKQYESQYSEQFLTFMRKENMTIPHEYMKHCIFYTFKEDERPEFIFETNQLLKQYSYVCKRNQNVLRHEL